MVSSPDPSFTFGWVDNGLRTVEARSRHGGHRDHSRPNRHRFHLRLDPITSNLLSLSLKHKIIIGVLYACTLG